MKLLLLFAAALLLLNGPVKAIDNGDGTYSNPMIHADYPDCDVIRVGKDFYYLSSSFHFIPGDPIMHSRDLVNWKPIGFTIPDYKWDKRYNLDENGSRYGGGSWAPSLRYHNGMYYAVCNVWYGDNQDSMFVISRAKNIEGPWETNLIHQKLYDPGLFFDDDGKVYVVHGQNDIYVAELDSDLRKVITPDKLVYSGSAYYEGSHAYKINGMYYLYNTSWGQQQCLRSKSIYGPYEHKTVLSSELNFPGTFLHQGGLVDTPTGEWWAIIFEDRGKHGRIPFLLPVKWEDGWPMVLPVMTHAKPNMGGKPEKIDEGWRSDDFNSPKLGLQWQWNHQPNDAFWSLTERPGFLRLHTTHVTDVLRRAQNTLTQRILGPDSGAIVKIDVSHLQDGDFAGLGLFSADSSSIAIASKNGQKYIAVITEPNTGWINYDKKEVATANLQGNTVWLRAEIPYLQYAVNYSYSFDGKTFTKLGDTLGIPYEFFSDWMAPRYCIYNYATAKVGGYVDVDAFHYILPKRENNFYAFGDKMDTQFCDDIDIPDNCSFKWIEDGMPNIFVQDPGEPRIGTGKQGPVAWTAAVEGKKPGSWVKFNRVDFGGRASAIEARVQGGGEIAIHLNDQNGPVVADKSFSSDSFTTLDMPLQAATKGIHPVVAVFNPTDGKTVVLKQIYLEGK